MRFLPRSRDGNPTRQRGRNRPQPDASLTLRVSMTAPFTSVAQLQNLRFGLRLARESSGLGGAGLRNPFAEFSDQCGLANRRSATQEFNELFDGELR